MDTITIIRGLACAVAACGIYLLWAATRQQGGYAVRLIGGWSLIVSAIVGWSMTSSVEKGAAMGIIAVVLAALALLAAIALQGPPRSGRSSTGRAMEVQQVEFVGYGRRVLVGVLIGPIACLSAVAICTAAFLGFQNAGVEHTINLTIVSFALPVIWGLLSIWGGADPKLWRKSLTILGCGLLPLAYIVTLS